MNAAPQNEFFLLFAVMLGLMVLLTLLAIFILFATLFGPWMRGFLSGVPVSIFQIIGMRLRREPPGLIIDALISLVHRGHTYNRMLCAHAESIYLAQRGLITSPEHLADMVEKKLAVDAGIKS